MAAGARAGPGREGHAPLLRCRILNFLCTTPFPLGSGRRPPTRVSGSRGAPRLGLRHPDARHRECARARRRLFLSRAETRASSRMPCAAPDSPPPPLRARVERAEPASWSNLRVLYLEDNVIDDWGEVKHLVRAPAREAHARPAPQRISSATAAPPPPRPKTTRPRASLRPPRAGRAPAAGEAPPGRQPHPGALPLCRAEPGRLAALPEDQRGLPWRQQAGGLARALGAEKLAPRLPWGSVAAAGRGARGRCRLCRAGAREVGSAARPSPCCRRSSIDALNFFPGLVETRLTGNPCVEANRYSRYEIVARVRWGVGATPRGGASLGPLLCELRAAERRSRSAPSLSARCGQVPEAAERVDGWEHRAEGQRAPLPQTSALGGAATARRLPERCRPRPGCVVPSPAP